MCDLRDIERICQNSGGIRTIRFIVPSHVSSIPTQYCTPNLAEDIELEEGKRSYVINFSKGSATFTERSVTDNRAGDFFQQTLVFYCAQDREEVADLAEKLKNRRFHIVYTDWNGKKKLAANLRLQSETTIGGKKADKNGTTFTATGRSEKKSPFIEGTISNEVPVDSDLILIAPNGQRYRVTVDACGALVTVPITSTEGLTSVMIDETAMYVDSEGALETEE